MPKDERAKVTLTPDAFKALQLEAMLHDTSLQETASNLIIKAACPKCKEMLAIMNRPNQELAQETKGEIDQLPKGTIAIKPKGEIAQVPIVPKAKRRRLSEDTKALERIKELWASGVYSPAKIGKAIGYAETTTRENIQKLREKGELV
jgi:hypothetical protein